MPEFTTEVEMDIDPCMFVAECDVFDMVDTLCEIYDQFGQDKIVRALGNVSAKQRAEARDLAKIILCATESLEQPKDSATVE